MLRELELLPIWRLRTPPLISMPSVEEVAVGQVQQNTIQKNTIQKNIEAVDMASPQLSNLIEVTKVDLTALPVVVTEIEELVDVVQPLPAMRLLVSEDSHWLFLLASAQDSSAKNAEAETLLQNMLRAISVTVHRDIANVTLAQLTQYPAKLIIAFGDIASQSLLGTDIVFEALRLKQHQQSHLHPMQFNAMSVVVTYHPSDLLQHLPNKAKAWDDLKLALSILKPE